MTAFPCGSGALHRARHALILALVALFTLAPAVPALANQPASTCPSEGASQPPQMQQVLTELAAFAQQSQSGTVPTQADLEAKLTQMFALMDYVLAEADTLTLEQEALLLDELKAALVAEGVPAAQVDTATTALADLLDSETPPTPEQALKAVYDAITPYLLELGVDQAYIGLLYTYLVKLLPARTPPAPCPTQTATPSPQPTTVAQPAASPSPSPSPSASAAAASQTVTAAPGRIATTGIDPILLLGVVAIAMIAGGLALEAGQRRPARNRSRKRR